jgi:CBS domain-containing protein
MTPDRLSHDLVRETPVLREDDKVDDAVRAILRSGLPALPVVAANGELKGIFGEREFMAALFPGYLGQLSHAGFIKHGLDDVIERRISCRADPVSKYLNTEHVAVGEDFSDVQIAETFLHHRVLIIPVVQKRHVSGVITRADFFERIAERFLEAR